MCGVGMRGGIFHEGMWITPLCLLLYRLDYSTDKDYGLYYKVLTSKKQDVPAADIKATAARIKHMYICNNLLYQMGTSFARLKVLMGSYDKTLWRICTTATWLDTEACVGRTSLYVAHLFGPA